MALEGGSEQGPLTPSGTSPCSPRWTSHGEPQSTHDSPTSTPSAGLLFIHPALSCPPLHGRHPSAHPWCHLCGLSLALPVPAPAWHSLKTETAGPALCPPVCPSVLGDCSPPRAPGSRALAAGSSGVFHGRSLGCEGGLFLASVIPVIILSLFCPVLGTVLPENVSLSPHSGEMGTRGTLHHGVGGHWPCCSETLF